ncbi:hypothetical protein [Streptomyces sp.]|uniref:hypothetical protein n=1 Tax=Streptomyces sp. TaxID=1931 RepID=UPI002F400B72
MTVSQPAARGTEQGDAPSDYTLLLPSGWFRIDLAPDGRAAAVAALVERQFQGLDDAPLLKAQAREELAVRAEEAYRNGGIELHLSLRAAGPLTGLQLVEIARSHEHMVMSNDQNAPWLFPTQRPGKPLTSRRLASRLRNIGLPSEAARCAALLDLCIQMPPAVLQRLLGVSSFAAERWAAGAVRTAYAAEVARRS